MTSAFLSSASISSFARTTARKEASSVDTISQATAQIRFDHIMTSDGLSNSTVNGIIQDKYGFMWFATGDGVDKYDGYRFTHYQSDLMDTNSLSSAYTNVIFEDKEGTIWIGTSNGLNRYDRDSGHFTHYFNNHDNKNSLSGNYITSICQDQKGILWFGSTNGLSSYNEHTKHFTQYLYNKDTINSLNDNTVSSICVDSDDKLWIGTDRGIAVLSSNREHFNHYYYSKDKSPSNQLASNEIYCLLIDKHKDIWIGTKNGLSVINQLSGKIHTYQHDPKSSTSLPNNLIMTILEDKRGQLWVGTEESGICMLDRTNNTFKTYTHSLFDENSLSGNAIYSMFEDKYGILWIGTYKAGLNKVKQVQIRHYKTNPMDKNSLSDNIVHAVYEDKSGYIWLGTENKGVDVYDQKNDRFLNFNKDRGIGSNLSSNGVWAVFEDSSGDVWIGTFEGMNILRRSTSKLSSVDPFTSLRTRKLDVVKRLKGIFITSIVEDKDKQLWIATYGDGLFQYDLKSQKFTQFKHIEGDSGSLSNDELWTLCLDNQNQIWIGSEGAGVDVLNPQKKSFTHKFSNPKMPGQFISNLVLTIHQDGNGYFWIGTWGYGLFKYNPKTNVLENYSRNNRLPIRIIFGILEDPWGNLWMSTNSGICKLNPSLTPPVLETLGESYGVQQNEFNIGAYSKTKKGDFVFGGIQGFNIINPATFKSVSNKPKIQLTGFWVKENIIDFGKDISDVKQIPLKYNDDTITFEFAALDYTNSAKNFNYKYKLEGNDDRWYTTNANFVTYTNLPSGQYTFKVRLFDDNSEASDSELKIQVKMASHPLKSWWAYTIYVLALIFAIRLLIHFYTRRGAQLIENELHKFAESLASTLDLDQVYEKFFINFKNLAEYDFALVYRLDDSYGILQVDYTTKRDGFSAFESLPQASKDLLTSIANSTVLTRKPLMINDTQHVKNAGYKLENMPRSIRSVLCIPMSYSGKQRVTLLFCSGNPSAFKRKFGFAITYASQAIIAMENARLFKDLNRSSEDIRNLLDHTGQGFLSFGPDLIVNSGYSQECVEIFGSEINGRYINELLCEKEEECHFFQQTIDKIFSARLSRARQQVYLSLLPMEIIINEKIIDCNFKLLESKLSSTDTIMVVLTDITLRRQLEAEMIREQDTLKMVVRVITHFNEFIEILKEYDAFCHKKLDVILESNDIVDKVLTAAYLEIHTFKGNFSQLNMLQTTQKLHDFETLLSDMKKNGSYYTCETLSPILKSYKLEDYPEADVMLLKSILGESIVSTNNMVSIDVEKLIEIEQRLSMLYPHFEANKLVEELKQYRCKSLKEMLTGYIDYSLKLSEKLEKLLNPPRIEGDDILVEPEKYFRFTRCLVHLFRNAVDHGIEYEFERIAAGKEPSGNIDCRICKVDDGIELSISDDGRGIEVAKIKEKARQLGFLTEQQLSELTETETYNLLFLPEFSTRNIITEISGRGIGLSAVESEVTKLGGTIKVSSEKGKGSTFYIMLPD